MATKIIINRSVTSVVRNAKPRIITRIQKGDPGSGYYTDVIATTDLTLQPNCSYIVKGGASRLIFTLPVIIPIGAKIRIIGADVGGWKVWQNNGQQSKLAGGPNKTAAGTAGFIQSEFESDCAEFFCTTANTSFTVQLIGCQANLE